MALDLYQVDAFAERPFAGNPAAVCLLPAPRPEEWMQQVAREMNLSETAFVVLGEDGFGLRWFTPTIEVELCGHATLASAHVLWESGRLGAGAPARFHTLSGLLVVERAGDWLEMDFPATPAAPEASPPEELLAALGMSAGSASVPGAPRAPGEPRFVGRSRFDYLVEVASEAEVRAVAPDFRRLAAVSARGVMVTAAPGGAPYDFVSRFFAPAAGIDEDPATGSAHCCLGPYWGARLGKSELLARQVSARGGIVRVRLAGDRVKVCGQAVTVLRGALLA